ncbi:MAG: hypothetical protein WBZ36_12940 [Candidatus Nitrosopolaris sp.]
MHVAEDIEAIATTTAIGTTAVVVLFFGIQTVLFFAIQAHPVFVIQALLLWVTQALLLWVTQGAKVKVILVTPQVTPEIMSTPENLFVCQVFSDNEIQWFAHEFAYDEKAWTRERNSRPQS